MDQEDDDIHDEEGDEEEVIPGKCCLEITININCAV